MDREGHTDTDPAHTGTHRHETLGCRCSGTVRIGGCTHRGTHGHVNPVYAGTCGHRCSVTVGTDRHTEGHTDAVTLCTDRHTPSPGRDTALGGTARTEVQGVLSGKTPPGNTQNAAPGDTCDQLGPCRYHPPPTPSRGLRAPQQQCNPIPKTPGPRSPDSTSTPSRASCPSGSPIRRLMSLLAVPGPGHLPAWPGRADVRLPVRAGDG